MKRLIFALLLLFTFNSSAFTVQEVNNALGSGDEHLQQVAATYLAGIIKTLHDVDNFNWKDGRIRSVCLTDGTSLPITAAYRDSRDIWNSVVQDIAARGASEEDLNRDVVETVIGFIARQKTCGPAI